MSTRKFFINNSINSFDDIKTLISDFHSFVFADGERAEALREMFDIIAEYNARLKADKVGEIANAENIVSAMIPEINLDAEKAKNSNFRKRAVYSAIAYKQYKITENKNGRYELREIEKAVTVRDIFDAMCKLCASKHADMKITKADRENAKSALLNGAENAFKAFMIGAYRFENIADKLVEKYPLEVMEDIFTADKPSKALAEKQIKRVAEIIGLGSISFRRVHALDLYKRAYTIDRYHQPKVADIIDFAQDFIITARYAKNNIELPEIKDNGGIFTADNIETASNVLIF
jgi:hypothetical protein